MEQPIIVLRVLDITDVTPVQHKVHVQTLPLPEATLITILIHTFQLPGENTWYRTDKISYWRQNGCSAVYSRATILAPMTYFICPIPGTHLYKSRVPHIMRAKYSYYGHTIKKRCTSHALREDKHDVSLKTYILQAGIEPVRCNK